MPAYAIKTAAIVKFHPAVAAATFLKYFLAHSAARESRRLWSLAGDVPARDRKKHLESYIARARARARDYGRERARSVIYVANKVLRINIILGRTLDSRAAAFPVFNSAIMRHDLSSRPSRVHFRGFFQTGVISGG